MGGHPLSLVPASLAQVTADVLVSSDDNYLSHGGGVSRALWRAAGPELKVFVEAQRPVLGLGDVFQTPAFRLKARHLLHAVTIDFDENRRLGAPDAVELYRRVLERAATLGSSVALPLLGSGAGRLGLVGSCRALCKAVRAARLPAPADFSITLSVLEANASEIALLLEQEADTGGRSHLSEARIHAVLEVLEALSIVLVQYLFSQAGEAERRAVLQDSRLVERLEDGAPLLTGLEHLTLGARIRLAVTLGGLPPELLRTLELASQARNAVVHGHVGREEPAHREALQQAVSKCFEFLDRALPPAASVGAVASGVAALVPIVGMAVGAPPGPAHARRALGVVASRVRAARKKSFPTETPVPAVAPDAHALTACPLDFVHGTHAVRELLAFFNGPLISDAKREELLGLARDREHRGTAEGKLLELCVEAKLEELFTELFNRGELLHICSALGLEIARRESPRPKAAELIAHLLDHVGFTAQQPVRGLATARAQLNALHVESLYCDKVEALRGVCVAAASELEFLLKSYLRYLCRAVFKEAPEHHFQVLGFADEAQRFSKLTLGSYVSLAGALFKELDQLAADSGTDVKVRQRLRDVPRPPARLDPLLLDLAAHRNLFTHDQGEPLEWDEARAWAKDFFDSARAWLALFEAPTTLEGDIQVTRFPRMVRVERVSLDRWGRRTSEAVDDAGRRERIFSDELLKPGELYFMHPLTNPVRVDPILVAVGETSPR